MTLNNNKACYFHSSNVVLFRNIKFARNLWQTQNKVNLFSVKCKNGDFSLIVKLVTGSQMR